MDAVMQAEIAMEKKDAHAHAQPQKKLVAAVAAAAAAAAGIYLFKRFIYDRWKRSAAARTFLAIRPRRMVRFKMYVPLPSAVSVT